MGKKPSLLDLSKEDIHRVLADLKDIRKENPHRFEMEMLTAIFHEDFENMICAGYYDVPENPYWGRGHMPGYPIMPGVLMCECVAQLASFYARKLNYLDHGIMALGGLDEVKFRGQVRPGDRMISIIKLVRGKPNMMMILQFEVIVNEEVVAEGLLKGVAIRDVELPPIPDEE